MKQHLLTAALVLLSFTSAHAMDDAERTRQMELYKVQSGGGAMITTTTSTSAIAPQPNAPTQQMSPLNDNGTPMNVPAMAESLGATEVKSQTSVVLPVETPNFIPATTVMTTQTAPVTTTTTEMTTQTDYTMTQRKVGLVGNRPFPATTSQIQGGSTKDISVNGQLVSHEVLTPDPVLNNQTPEGDYYSNRRAAKVFAEGDSNVRVINTGRFNR